MSAKKTRTWIYVQPHIVGNPERGYATTYSSDVEHCKTRDEAWQHGCWKVGSDDFLIAAMEGGRCVGLYFDKKGPKRRSAKEVRQVNEEFGWSEKGGEE